MTALAQQSLLRLGTDAAGPMLFGWDASIAPVPLLEAGTDRVVHRLGPLYIARADGSTVRLVRDALGSVRAELNDLGIVTKAFRYAAYGALSARSLPEATPTLLGFTGELADPNGLTYLRARWYDPGLGRFVAADPIFGRPSNPGSLNRFIYVQGRPTVATDPSGLEPSDASRFTDLASSLPDYYKLSLNVAIPNPITLTLVGASFGLTVDRYGRVYFGLGPSLGKTATVISGSVVGGYILQSTVPSSGAVNSFLQGWAISAGGGFVLGADVTFSPGATGQHLAVEPGLFSPQVGVNATYAWPIW